MKTVAFSLLICIGASSARGTSFSWTDLTGFTLAPSGIGSEMFAAGQGGSFRLTVHATGDLSFLRAIPVNDGPLGNVETGLDYDALHSISLGDGTANGSGTDWDISLHDFVAMPDSSRIWHLGIGSVALGSSVVVSFNGNPPLHFTATGSPFSIGMNNSPVEFTPATGVLQTLSGPPLLNDGQMLVLTVGALSSTDMIRIQVNARDNDGFRIALGLEHSPPATCAGNANKDNEVNGADLSVLLSQFGTSVEAGTGADFNNDGQVDGADLSVLLGAFGKVCQ